MGKTEKHENLGFNLTYPDTFENTKGAKTPVRQLESADPG